MQNTNKKTIKTSIGGQALNEGIMMRGPAKTAIAVRDPDGRIQLEISSNGTRFAKAKKIPAATVLTAAMRFIFCSRCRCLRSS